jgi:hypothetical protein
MALVRKTETLKSEIGRQLDEIVSDKVSKQIATLNLAGHAEQLLIEAFSSGQTIPVEVQEHLRKAQELDENNSLDIGMKLLEADFRVALVSSRTSTSPRNTPVINSFFHRQIKFPGEAFKFVTTKPKQIMAYFHRDFVHVFIGNTNHSTNFEMKIHLLAAGTDQTADNPIFKHTDVWMPTNFSSPVPEEQWTPTQHGAMDALNSAQQKLAKSIARVEKVRTYIFDKLWPNCASLNGMVKYFPGILEYVSDDTLKRFHKNAPRTASLNPELTPDAAVLATTAEAKLK